MNKYKVDIYKIVTSEWDESRDLIGSEETLAKTEAKAVNNVRYRMRTYGGLKDHDEANGSVSVRYEYEAHIISGVEQLKLF